MSELHPIPGPLVGEATVYSHVTKTAATIPISVEAWEDSRIVASAIGDTFDRWQHPWNYADRIAWPEFVPLPRLAAFGAAVRERRQRLRDAWLLLRGDARLYDPDEDDSW